MQCSDKHNIKFFSKVQNFDSTTELSMVLILCGKKYIYLSKSICKEGFGVKLIKCGSMTGDGWWFYKKNNRKYDNSGCVRKFRENRLVVGFLINPQIYCLHPKNANCHKFQDVPEASNFLTNQ